MLDFKKLNWRMIILLAFSPMAVLSVELLSEYSSRVYGADEAAVGLLGGSGAGAAALASLLLFLKPSLEPEKMVLKATLVYWLANMLCMFSASLEQLMLLNLIMGAAAGLVCTKSYQVLTSGNEPSRQLGAVIALQAVALSLSFLAIPWLSDLYQEAYFLVMAVWFSVCLFCAPGLADLRGKVIASASLEPVSLGSVSLDRGGPKRWLFISVAALYMCHGGYNTFIAEFASQQGISLETSGWVLTAGCAVGFITGLWSANEESAGGVIFSTVRPIGIALAAMVVGALLLLEPELSVSGYLASVVIYNFGWCFAVPYQVQAAANINDGGRASLLLLFLQSMGIAIGAILVGQFAVIYGIAVTLNVFIPILGGISLYAIYRSEKSNSNHLNRYERAKSIRF